MEYFKKGSTIYDPETADYQKILTVQKLKIRGVWRVFYDLGCGAGTAPESRWREHHQVLYRKPTAEDIIV